MDECCSFSGEPAKKTVNRKGVVSRCSSICVQQFAVDRKLNAKDERNNNINNYKNVFLPGLMTRCTQLIEGNVPVSLGSNDIALQNQSQTKEEKSNGTAL